MRVLLAFDKFKGSLTAPQACSAAALALGAAHSEWTIDSCPLADGGDGFASILTDAAGGTIVRRRVSGPRGEPVDAAFGLVPLSRLPAAARGRLDLGETEGTLALVEMASASGLALLPAEQQDPWLTSTFGTGELLRAARDAGAAAIVLGAGGSATHDLGLGALVALGLECRNQSGEPVFPPIPRRWPEITRIDGGFSSLPPVRIACDVTNPLLGPRGAAAVFAPQKGLRPEDQTRLEHATARMALMLGARFGRPESLLNVPGTGAAGGIAYGFMAALEAQLVPGFALVADWLDLAARVEAADLVLTGEGRFDASSLGGKGPGEVLRLARSLHKPVHLFAGALACDDPGPGVRCHTITPPDAPWKHAVQNAAGNLANAVRHALASA